MSNTDPLVSVIIPTRNRRELLLRALQTVQEQTYTNWEAIVVDDLSDDDTQAALRAIAEPRIQSFLAPHRLGVSGARNFGALHARGEYVAFLDSDDEWRPEKLAGEVALFRRSGPEVGMVYSGIIFRDEEGAERIRIPNRRGWIHNEVLRFNPIGSPSRVMVRRSCLDSVGGFDEELFASEDWELYARITERWAVDFVPAQTVVYREHSESLSGSPFRSIEGRMQLWKKCGIDRSGRDLRAFHYARLAHDLSYRGAPCELPVAFFLRAFWLAPWRIHYLLGAVLAAFSAGNYHRLAFCFHRFLHQCRSRLLPCRP